MILQKICGDLNYRNEVPANRVHFYCSWKSLMKWVFYFLVRTYQCINLYCNLQLTHWGQDKMAANLQMTFPNYHFLMKIISWFKFDWNSFSRVQLKTSRSLEGSPALWTRFQECLRPYGPNGQITIIPHLPMSSRVLGCEENLYLECWNSQPHPPI